MMIASSLQRGITFSCARLIDRSQLNLDVMPQPNSEFARRDNMQRSFSSSQAVVTDDDSDPRDPSAQCDRCGTRGTVARAVRHTEPPLVLRYCSSCWPAAQEELEARQRDELKQWRDAQRASREVHNRRASGAAASPSDLPAWTIASRSWYDVRGFLALIEQTMKGGPAPTSADLAAIAADIGATAAEMDGPIPPDVEDFIAKHSPPAA